MQNGVWLGTKSLRPKLGVIGSHIILIHAVAIVLVPVFWILDVAMSPGNILGGDLGVSDWTGEHFSKILDRESSFWIWMRELSLVVSLGTTLMGLLLAVPAAYAFSRFKFSGRQASMFAFLLVQMFPGIIILVPYFMVMKIPGITQLEPWIDSCLFGDRTPIVCLDVKGLL